MWCVRLHPKIHTYVNLCVPHWLSLQQKVELIHLHAAQQICPALDLVLMASRCQRILLDRVTQWIQGKVVGYAIYDCASCSALVCSCALSFEITDNRLE